jgi:hypothetical protein
MTEELNAHRFGRDLPKRLQNGFFNKLSEIEREARSRGAWQAGRELDEIVKKYRETQKERMQAIHEEELKKRAEIRAKQDELHKQLNALQEELNEVYNAKCEAVADIDREAYNLPEYQMKEQVKNILWKTAHDYEAIKQAELVAVYQKKAEKTNA